MNCVYEKVNKINMLVDAIVAPLRGVKKAAPYFYLRPQSLGTSKKEHEKNEKYITIGVMGTGTIFQVGLLKSNSLAGTEIDQRIDERCQGHAQGHGETKGPGIEEGVS
jgi:hypothetical protein